MTFKDVVAKKTFTSNGEEKTKWLKVGTLKVTDEGKMFLELNHNPSVDYYIFDQEAKVKDEKSTW